MLLPANPASRSEGNTWKLMVAYDGTDFNGWQVQPNLPTVQGELAKAVLAVTGEAVLPQGSGRTDTGVHAAGQVVSLVLRADIAPSRLASVLNRRLPASIRVLEASRVAPDFHARGGVISKLYRYRLFQRRRWPGQELVCPPQLARYVWDCRWPLHVEPMRAAAAAVLGTHDFTSFAAHDPDRSARGPGADASDRTRTVFRSDWQLVGDELHYEVSGSGFLHHMVRNLVGTFVEVGLGRRTAESISGSLHARDRRAAGPTAPPQGLSLQHVVYAAEALDCEARPPHSCPQSEASVTAAARNQTE